MSLLGGVPERRHDAQPESLGSWEGEKVPSYTHSSAHFGAFVLRPHSHLRNSTSVDDRTRRSYVTRWRNRLGGENREVGTLSRQDLCLVHLTCVQRWSPTLVILRR